MSDAPPAGDPRPPLSPAASALRLGLIGVVVLVTAGLFAWAGAGSG